MTEPINVNALQAALMDTIRDIHDVPKKGIIFKDITPVLYDAELSKVIDQHLKEYYTGKGVDAVAGIESRGFFYGFSLAKSLGVPFIPIRKQGKLPFIRVSIEYAKEYGTDIIEMNADAVHKDQRVLIHDDLLATGGTAAATAKLITQQGGIVAGFNFLVTLGFLKGHDNLSEYSDNIYEILKF